MNNISRHLCLSFGISIAVQSLTTSLQAQETKPSQATKDVSSVVIKERFVDHIQPLLKKYCLRCHNADNMKSGIRVDHLTGQLEGRSPFLWQGILEQISTGLMPPEDEEQLNEEQRTQLIQWAEEALIFAKRRQADKNGSVRRLTVAQYRNSLRDLLGITDDLTEVLPPDAVSKDGFLNNEQTMLLSPLLVEAYFNIAEKALDLCIVDEDAKPVIQNFRMDLGAAINPEPCPDDLILGALSRLLPNQDFIVSQLAPTKPFEYTPFFMRTEYRFIEGYEGNGTVRGWREYDSIYHAVFACVRGSDGYPKGSAWETIPEGLLLRPAIPSEEIFGQSSTYGPRANFKISLRELPDLGRFRVKVRATPYDDALLLDPGATVQEKSHDQVIVTGDLTEPQIVQIPQAGIYQAEVYLTSTEKESVTIKDSRIEEGLIGHWKLDGNAQGVPGEKNLDGQLQGDVKFVTSPFGQSASLSGDASHVVVPHDDRLHVDNGDFTVAAWIKPRELRQSGIVSLGGYGYTHGWLFDMPNGNGVIRIETAKADGLHNGTVESKAGVIRANQWQHVAVTVQRGDKATRLYVNGYEVGVGTIGSETLNNPKVSLHIGSIQNSAFFAGEIDEVRIYRRALEVAELEALIEPGRQFATAPNEPPQNLTLQLNGRWFSGLLRQPAFMLVRTAAGPLTIAANHAGSDRITRLVLSPLENSSALAKRFQVFEQRRPRLGVHLGLRRDCGSTLNPVGAPQTVSNDREEYVFEEAISNFPSPDVEKDNVNYLAGIREIGVRSEYTDGRDMPRMLVQSIEFEGPLFESWPPQSHTNIFFASPDKNKPAVYAREVITSFAQRAFRRPLTPVEADALHRIWEDAYTETKDFQQSVQDALLVVLTSPQFLFLIETSETPEPETINMYELAAKLSYFLWNASPDEKLLEHAEQGTLSAALDTEIVRLIENSQFAQFTNEFASQWLALEKLDVVDTDLKRHPKLTRDTKTALRQEPIEFLQYLIQHNLPLKNILQSDFVVANEVVANYYDLGEQTESGFNFVPIPHHDDNLGGLLSQAGILAGLSDGRKSNPIKRGAWLARKIIAEPPDDPPPNVPTLPEDDGAQLTLSEKLARHRNQEGCMKCHAGIDPWGLPFEEYDAAGRFRRDAEVNIQTTLPDSTPIKNSRDLKSYLAQKRMDQVAFSFMKHLASYATGRNLTYNEIEFLKEEGVQLRENDYLMHDLFRFIIQSDLFLTK